MRREISGGELSRGNFTLGIFDRFPMWILFVCLNLSLPIHFCMWRRSREIFCVFGCLGNNSTEGGISGMIQKLLEFKVFLK